MNQYLKIIGCIFLIILSYPINAVERLNSPYLFIGEDKIFGKQLWQTDNTEKGTHVHTFVQTHPNADSNPYPLASLKTGVIFAAFTSTGEATLWRTDGTSEGTVRLTDLANNQYNSTTLKDSLFKDATAQLGETLLFWSIGNNNTLNLKITDGNPHGTQILKSFPYKTHFDIYSKFYLLDKQAYFSVTNDSKGSEWWVTDGTIKGTHHLTYKNPSETISSDFFPNELTYYSPNEITNILVTEQALYLLETHTQESQKPNLLWKITAQGAEKIYEFTDMEFPYNLLGVYGDHLFWQAKYQYEGQTVDISELWHLSLSTGQAEKVYEFKSSATGGIDIYKTYFFNNHLYFSTFAVDSNEVWVSDLTTQGTLRLAQLEKSYPDYIVAPSTWFNFMGNLYFFSMNDQ